MIKLGFVLFSFVLFTACSSPDQQTSAENSEEMQIQIVNESDSLSYELSTAGDSIDKKMKDLQATLDNLEN